MSKPRLEARVALVALVASLSAVGLLVVAGSQGTGPLEGLQPQCACASTRDPNWTPSPTPPVSLARAASAASRIVGVEMSPAQDWYSIDDVAVSMPTAGATLALVRGDDATVLEVVVRDRLPASDSVAVGEAAARASAEAFVSRAGIDLGASHESSALERPAGVPFYQVAWASGEAEPSYEILVNASSGQVFAFVRFGTGVRPPAPPVLAYQAAVRLAVGSSEAAGETPWPIDREPELQLYPGSPDGHDWTWQVGFSDGVLAVDAASGEVWIMKWSQTPAS
jgi:hypothetical protein